MTKTRTLPIDARSYSRWVQTKTLTPYYQNPTETAATGFLPQGVSVRLLARTDKKLAYVWTANLERPVWIPTKDLEVIDLLTPKEAEDKLRAHPRHHCMKKTEYQFNVKVRKAFPKKDGVDLTKFSDALLNEVLDQIAVAHAGEWLGFPNEKPETTPMAKVFDWLVAGSWRFEGRMAGHIVLSTTFDMEDKLNTLQGYMETFEATWTYEIRDGCQTNIPELMQTMTMDYHDMWKLRAELSTFARDIDALAEWMRARANSTYLEAVMEDLSHR